MSNSRVEFLGDEPLPTTSAKAESTAKPESEPPTISVQEKEQNEADEMGEGIDVDVANRLKQRGNKAYAASDYEEAIRLYDLALARTTLKPKPDMEAINEKRKLKEERERRRSELKRKKEKLVDPKPEAHAFPFESAEEKKMTKEEKLARIEEDLAKIQAEEDAAAEAERNEPVDTTDYTLPAQLFCNSGQVLLKQEKYEEAVEKLSEAIRHKPDYDKAYFRRATCYYNLEQWASANGDYSKCDELHMTLDADARQKQAHAKKKTDEEMQKMWGQLKDLGNMFLGKFGMSMDNFKFDKDAKTGGYNMRFEQNPNGADDAH